MNVRYYKQGLLTWQGFAWKSTPSKFVCGSYIGFTSQTSFKPWERSAAERYSLLFFSFLFFFWSPKVRAAFFSIINIFFYEYIYIKAKEKTSTTLGSRGLANMANNCTLSPFRMCKCFVKGTWSLHAMLRGCSLHG